MSWYHQAVHRPTDLSLPCLEWDWFTWSLQIYKIDQCKSKVWYWSVLMCSMTLYMEGGGENSSNKVPNGPFKSKCKDITSFGFRLTDCWKVIIWHCVFLQCTTLQTLLKAFYTWISCTLLWHLSITLQLLTPIFLSQVCSILICLVLFSFSYTHLVPFLVIIFSCLYFVWCIWKSFNLLLINIEFCLAAFWR